MRCFQSMRWLAQAAERGGFAKAARALSMPSAAAQRKPSVTKKDFCLDSIGAGEAAP